MKKVKKILAAALACCTIFTVSMSNTVNAGTSANTEFASEFANPDSSYKPMTRMWWPNAPVDLDELESEVRAIADAGYGGIEIACVADSSGWVDPVEYGWGSDAWNEAIKLTLEVAKEVGITIDLTVGPHWPLSIPGVNPDTEDSAKVLQTGQVLVSSGTTYSGAAPACDTEITEGWEKDELLYASAARITGENDGEYSYDANSLVDVEIKSDGTIEWTAPSDGDYILFTYWMRGSGQRAQKGMNPTFELSDPIPYTVDHFSIEGTMAFINYWEDNLLPEDIVDLLQDVGGSMFEDSLELSGDIQWTAKLAEYFEEHRGYDLTPYLPILYGMTVSDEEMSERVLEDYYQTLNDMYIEYHVQPMQEWMNSYGLNFRTQSYGGCVDSSQTGSLVDIIEGELLTFSGNTISLEGDNTEAEWTVNNKFRMLRGGANLGKANIVSDEIGSLMGGDWSLTLTRLVSFMNSDFSAGVNNMVLHGYPYKYAPETHWPTYAAFAPMNFYSLGKGFGVSLNNYTPQWEAWDELLQYVGRTQYILQQGQSKVDVAIYRHELSTDGTTISDPALVDMGYTYDYVSPNALIDNSKAYVKNGILAPEDAAYQVMVLYDTEYITIEGAQLLLDYADAGLPIVVVGTVPSKVKGYGSRDKDSEITAMMEKLLAKSNVSYVSDDSQLSQAVADAGAVPSTSFSQNEKNLSTVRREDSNVDYYYLFNRSSEEYVDVAFEGNGVPYVLDAYTGEVSRLAEYSVSNGTITANIKLSPRDTIIIAIGDSDWYSDSNSDEAYIVSTDAEGIFDQNGLNLKSSETGAYYAELSDGTKKEVKIESSEALELNNWHLSLESWTPTNPDYSGVEDLSRYDTTKTVYELEIGDVVPWTEIEGYESVCGIGTYSTSFTLDSAWSGGYNAVLDIGLVKDGYEVYINGHQVYANQISNTVDLSSYLKQGENSIEIKVTSTLINVLKEYYPDLYSLRDSTVNGMTENPTLVPYGIVTLSENSTNSKTSSSSQNSDLNSMTSGSSQISDDNSVDSSDITSGTADTPKTGDANINYIFAIVAIGSISAYTAVKCKRKRAEKK